MARINSPWRMSGRRLRRADAAYLDRLAGEDRNLAQRVLDAIRDILRRLKTALGSGETKRLDRAARLWEQALRETNAAYYQEGGRSNAGARNMYAGERAATADMDMLTKAKEMDAQDVSAETIAAPVVINKKPGIMGVVVQHTNGNNYKAHKILIPDGTAFVLEENKETVSGPVMAQSEMDRLDKRTDTASGDSVPQERSSVKGARELQRQIDRLEKQNKRLREQMKTTVSPMPSRKAVEQQATDLRKAYSSKMDKAELTELLDRLWRRSFLRQTLSESEMERYTACKKSGVTMQEWAEAYSAISGAVYQRTGKHGSHTQADAETALNGMKGLSDQKKTAIWDSYGWKKDSPWG